LRSGPAEPVRREQYFTDQRLIEGKSAGCKTVAVADDVDDALTSERCGRCHVHAISLVTSRKPEILRPCISTTSRSSVDIIPLLMQVG